MAVVECVFELVMVEGWVVESRACAFDVLVGDSGIGEPRGGVMLPGSVRAGELCLEDVVDGGTDGLVCNMILCSRLLTTYMHLQTVEPEQQQLFWHPRPSSSSKPHQRTHHDSAFDPQILTPEYLVTSQIAASVSIQQSKPALSVTIKQMSIVAL